MERIFEHYGEDNRSVIEEYFQFLLDNEYIFFCEESETEQFPDVSLSLESPFLINNCIIDSQKYSNHNWKFITSELDELNCPAVQLRFFYREELQKIERILQLFDDSSIKNIDLLVEYDETIEVNAYLQLCDRFPRLSGINICNAPQDNVILTSLVKPVSFYSQKILDHQFCGIIHPAYFSINREVFIEATSHNTCLYKKISIDADGQIRNCPSMKESFGSITQTRLRDIALRPEFQFIGTIAKKNIDECRNCEFRMICTDCRAYLTQPEDIYSKPLKCGYNPETMEWQEWSKIPENIAAKQHYCF